MTFAEVQVLPKVREGVKERSGGPPGGLGNPLKGPGGVGMPYHRSGRTSWRFRRVGMPSQKSGRGREDLSEVWEILPEVQVWQGSGGPPGGLEGIRRFSQRSRRKLPEVGRPFRRSGRGREAFPKVCKGSGGPPGGLR